MNELNLTEARLWVDTARYAFAEQGNHAKQGICETIIKVIDLAEWQTLDTIPEESCMVDVTFIVRWENNMSDFIELQVSWFEGHLYPDHLGDNISHDDSVEGYTHWKPLLRKHEQHAGS